MHLDDIEWLLLRLVGHTTARQYARTVLEACHFLGRENLDDARLDDLVRYIGHRWRPDEAPSTRARRVSALRCYFRARWYCYDVLNDAAARLARPRMNDPLPSFMWESHVHELLDGLHAHGVSFRDRALLELIYATGLRLGLVVALSRKDLDLSVGRLVVPGEGRLVPVGSRARLALQAYLDLRSDQHEAVFLSGGGRLTRRAASHAIREIALSTGYSGLTARALRGSCAAHLLDQDVDVRYVQALMGHRQAASTARYLRVAPRRNKETHAFHHPREGVVVGGPRRVDPSP